MGVHELQRGREKLLKCSDFKPVKLNFFLSKYFIAFYSEASEKIKMQNAKHR